MNRIKRESLAARAQSVRQRLKPPTDPVAPRSAWLKRRGEQRYAGMFDVIGNFPGCEDLAGLIVNAEVAVTDYFLLIDEGEPHGFALGIGWIVDVSADGDPDTFGDVLIRYRSDDANVLFRLRPARTRMLFRSRTRPEALIAALSDAGAEQADLARDVANTLRLSWDSIQSLESESVLWRGATTAPLRPGLECIPASVWLTPTSLIWGSPKGTGLNRLPITTIARLATFTLEDPINSPIVYIRTRIISDVRLDLPFIFNLGSVREAMTTRTEFLAMFRPEAIIEGVVGRRSQPWLDIPPAEPANDDDDIAESETDLPETDDTFVTRDDELPKYDTWTNVARPTAFPYVAPLDRPHSPFNHNADASNPGRSNIQFDSAGTRLVDAITSWPGGHPQDASTTESPLPQVTQPDVILTYLADAQRTISEVNESIDRRLAGQSAPLLRATPPSSSDQAQALAELIELTGSDYYSLDQARSVKVRITRLGEAAVRLRSIIELCNAGHLSVSEVGSKRDTIVANLPAASAEE